MKNVTIFIEDIMENISLVEKFISDMNKAQFMKDIKTHYSTLLNKLLKLDVGSLKLETEK